jgi:hypothetical protein
MKVALAMGEQPIIPVELGRTMNEELERYLADVASQLSVDPTSERAILWEIRSHLEEAAAELREHGLGEAQSWALAVDSFGESREVGRMLGCLHSESANQAVLAAFLPVALALTFKWILLPLLRSLAHWQASPTPIIFACLAVLALLVPGLTFRKWSYGYGVWAFFSLVTIAQL